jgi:hypothetical protein
MKPFAIRCGTPDCDWSYKMHGMGEDQLRLCHAEFRKHCMQRHDLQEWDTTPHVHFDQDVAAPPQIGEGRKRGPGKLVTDAHQAWADVARSECCDLLMNRH